MVGCGEKLFVLGGRNSNKVLSLVFLLDVDFFEDDDDDDAVEIVFQIG